MNSHRPIPKLVGTGFAVGLRYLEGLHFDSSRPYVFCRICGDIRQSERDRSTSLEIQEEAEKERSEWRRKHNRKHSDTEHIRLALSGLFLTPEAATKLAPFGVIDLVSLSIDDEGIDAYGSAGAVPSDDADS